MLQSIFIAKHFFFMEKHPFTYLWSTWLPLFPCLCKGETQLIVQWWTAHWDCHDQLLLSPVALQFVPEDTPDARAFGFREWPNTWKQTTHKDKQPYTCKMNLFGRMLLPERAVMGEQSLLGRWTWRDIRRLKQHLELWAEKNKKGGRW